MPHVLFLTSFHVSEGLVNDLAYFLLQLLHASSASRTKSKLKALICSSINMPGTLTSHISKAPLWY